MENLTFDSLDIEQLQKLVDGAVRVAITCHVAPDGDAIGSTLALWHLLKRMGKRPVVITPDVPTKSLMFLPGASEIVPASKYTECARIQLQAADLVVCLDFNALMRVDKLQPLLEEATAPKVLIDHHLSPEDFASLTISRPQASSTCYLLYEVIKAAGYTGFVDKDVAECIYTGMMTDTGNFSYNSNDPRLYVDIAELLRYGIDKDWIYKQACDTKSINQIRLNAFALSDRMKVYPDHRVAVISLRRGDLLRFDYVKGDTEGLVNVPLSSPEIIWSIFAREDENYVKMSLRSKGDFPVNKVCEDHFGGGGHLNAAGGELHCSLEEALRLVEAVLPEYDKYLPR